MEWTGNPIPVALCQVRVVCCEIMDVGGSALIMNHDRHERDVNPSSRGVEHWVTQRSSHSPESGVERASGNLLN